MAGTTATTLGWSCRSGEPHPAKTFHARCCPLLLLLLRQQCMTFVIIGVISQAYVLQHIYQAMPAQATENGCLPIS